MGVFLSKRLAAAADMVAPGSRVADIGTDHAYLPIWLVSEGMCPSAIAADLRPGPLLAAREHVREAGLDNRISLRLSDGLKEVAPGEVDTITITGMGGPLICRILEDGETVARSAKELILSPQSEVPGVRRFLLEHGYTIIDEAMVSEDGKYYVIIKASPNYFFTRPADKTAVCDDELNSHEHKPDNHVMTDIISENKAVKTVGMGSWSDEEILYGRYLMKKRPKVFIDYLDWQIKKLNDVCAALSKEKTERSKLRLAEIKTELETVKRIRS